MMTRLINNLDFSLHCYSQRLCRPAYNVAQPRRGFHLRRRDGGRAAHRNIIGRDEHGAILDANADRNCYLHPYIDANPYACITRVCRDNGSYAAGGNISG